MTIFSYLISQHSIYILDLIELEEKLLVLNVIKKQGEIISEVRFLLCCRRIIKMVGLKFEHPGRHQCTAQSRL